MKLAIHLNPQWFYLDILNMFMYVSVNYVAHGVLRVEDAAIFIMTEIT